MNKELPKAYAPQDYEDKIYKNWEESGFFNPDNLNLPETAKSFSIVLPPPNVTGHLHLGHAVMLALQDIMVRYHRMQGDKTLWVPGTDHAAIATQSKVEALIWEKEKKTRHDLGRPEFLKRVERFACDSHDVIVKQCKKMGASLDWDREIYTLDEARNKAVNTAFKKMYEDGLIYRGARIVNWDPKMQTTVSDDEVEYQEEKAPFYFFRYGPFTISTARPETKFGDKYVVMHPDDERYADYKHGQKIKVEWINGEVEATVIKDKAVDKDFGTGVMTITPWHDLTDFDIAERHNLDKEQIIDYQGRLLPIAGEFAGQEILEARRKIVEKLKNKGLVVKVDDDYLHNVATNSRGGGLIEPQIKRQWFIDVNKEFTKQGKKTSLKKLMQEAVQSKQVEIIPERFQKVYFHWIDNLRDWCISRQIWFGHQIPVWYKGEDVFVGANRPEGEGWEQDPDTLDTWFSSGLWTFSALGWPDNFKDGKKLGELGQFHPTQVLETGYDILFFWVARMILMTTYLLDEVPFEKVYLHGLVRDEKGRKMSKSLGNVIDPLDVIAKYGTDAVRLALVIGSTPGNDVRLSEEKIASFRNFTNKLWNISRFIIQKEKNDVGGKDEDAIDVKDLTLADKWILSETGKLVGRVTEDIEKFNFSQAGEKLQNFTWNDFADWYLEVSKFENNQAKDLILTKILETILKLWHPFMPFVTEAIWQEAGNSGLLLVEPWPKKEKLFALKNSADFEIVKSLVILIRNARSENKIEPGKKIKAVIYAPDSQALIESQADLIKGLRTGIAELEVKASGPKIEQEIYIPFGQMEIYLIGGIDKDKEEKRLEKESGNLEKLIASMEKKLSNKEFLDKAPEAIVKKEKEKLKTWQDDLEKLKKRR